MNNNQEYYVPRSMEEAIQISSTRPDIRFVAGATDAYVNKFQGNDKHSCLVDLTQIPELKTINKAGGYLHVGSLITLEDLAQDKNIRVRFPELIKAILSVATPVIRKSATIGGNILCENRCIFYNQTEWWRDAAGNCLKCNGDVCIATGGKKNCFSRFVSDLAPVLISLDATINVINTDGGFICPLENIYTGNGLIPRKISGNELLTAIHIPTTGAYKCHFRKLRLRNSLDFTSLTTAVSVNESGRIKIAMGGVDPKPVVIRGSRKDDPEELISQAVKKARVVENDVLPRSYRREMIAVYLRESLRVILDSD